MNKLENSPRDMDPRIDVPSPRLEEKNSKTAAGA
jgi:hypothetical protein